MIELKPDNIDNLITEIRATIGNPVNKWAVASTIESMGIRNVDVKRSYGADSIFELSGYIYDKIKQIELENERSSKADESKFIIYLKRFFSRVGTFFNYYRYGLMYILPMLTQVIALFWFKYSLWAYLYFNVAQATIIALGTMLGFIVTGGVVQVLGRVASFYVGMENYKLAKTITQNLIALGILALIVIAAILYLLNILIPFYPQSMFILSMIYGLLIGVLILAGASLYALKQTFIIATAIIIGTALVIINVDYFHMNIYLSQWLGIFVSIVLMLLYSSLYFNIKLRSMNNELQTSELPRLEVIFYENYRYFLYGFLYFLFLFLDRILAWSAGPPPPTYIIWFRTPYELGMDWALLSLILTVGALEYSINAFSKILLPMQKKMHLNNVPKFNKYFFSFYIRQIILVLFVGGLSIFIAYHGVLYLKPLGKQYPIIKDFFSSHVTFKVFWIASFGYLFLSIGLLHTLFFFTLARPKYVIYTMILATVVNFVVGYVLSRTLSYEDAVIGMAVGSLIFAIATGVIAVRFFKRMDYYYYSAY